MTKQIIKYPDNVEDFEWKEIINGLTEQLTDKELPENVIVAAEMLVSGFPTYEIAKHLGVKTSKVKSWLFKYPEMTRAVAMARKDLSRYRLQKLEPMFFHALEKIKEVLTAESYIQEDSEGNIILSTPNAKLLGVQGQMARYVISLFMGKQSDININIKDERPLLRTNEGGLDYLAKKLLEMRDKQEEEPIEAEVRVIDPKKEKGPILNEEGDPNFGELGILDHNDTGTLCHICGKRFKRLDIHIRVKENLSNEMYETIFMLAPGSLKEINERDNDKQKQSES
jgi:hypothetical protein